MDEDISSIIIEGQVQLGVFLRIYNWTQLLQEMHWRYTPNLLCFQKTSGQGGFTDRKFPFKNPPQS